jgi:2-polyprenyl-3-methyl-5-hydroxy-6-metoxy-1,4-benzoquinol methylase
MTQSGQSEYAQNQINHYKRLTVSLESAKRAVGPNYESLHLGAITQALFVLETYVNRLENVRLDFKHHHSLFKKLRVLDFGCGTGRIMEGFRKHGVEVVDGVDLSQEMIDYAKQSQSLLGSNFYLSSGMSLGAVPLNYYDVISAFLVMHHISMRQTRIEIIKSMYNSLNEAGMVFLEYKIYPGISKAQVPRNHATWEENRVAISTNSGCDVWITPEDIGLLYQDLRLYFKDICFIEVDIPNDKYNYNSEARYQYGGNKLFVAASKNASLRKKL